MLLQGGTEEEKEAGERALEAGGRENRAGGLIARVVKVDWIDCTNYYPLTGVKISSGPYQNLYQGFYLTNYFMRINSSTKK